MFGSHLQHETDERHHEQTDRDRSKSRLAVVGFVLLLLVGTLGWALIQALGNDDESAGLACETTLVQVAVAPAMTNLVDDAVASLQTDIRCIEIDVTTATVADVAEAHEGAEGEDDGALPDLWVPDSPAWHSVLLANDSAGTVLVPSLATTPVALAGGVNRSAGGSWADVMASPHLTLADPHSDGASAIALTAPFGEGDPTAAANTMVPVAQEFGDDLASGNLGVVTIDNLVVGSRKLLPVTERDFLIAQRGNEALQWRVPADGVAMLDYPLVRVFPDGGANSVSTGSLDMVVRTGERIAEWFSTKEGQAALVDEKLRGPNGAPLPDQGVVSRKQLPQVPQGQIDDVMKDWNSLIKPSSILTLMEVSDSMATPFGAMTRIELAADAAKTALAVSPDAVRVGVWAFSTNQRQDGRNWREVTPLRRLDAPLGQGRTQADALEEQLVLLPTQTAGGSGLYDTVLAGYRQALRQYNPYYGNAMVVFTDGPDDDPSSISVEDLKRELKALQNPDTPVRIEFIAVGLDDSADLATLDEIAAVTPQGGAYPVVKPEDILTILVSTLLAHE